MQVAEKCAVTDEFTTQEVIAKHHNTIRETLILLSNCLDSIVQAWVDEDAAALDKAVDEAVEAVPASVEDALERLEELTAHSSELETVITHLKSLHLYDVEEEEGE